MESRLRYLRHWRKLGAKRSTLRGIALNQLEMVRLLDLREGSGKVPLAQVEAAARSSGRCHGSGGGASMRSRPP